MIIHRHIYPAERSIVGLTISYEGGIGFTIYFGKTRYQLFLEL